jgi:hypothetical protein
MNAPTYIILALAVGFALGVAWHAMFHREIIRYRIPVATARHPRPGTACQDLHHHISAGDRCYVCGKRIGGER